MRAEKTPARGPRRALSLAGLGAAAALVLTGCGVDEGAAPDAWKQARAQLEQAQSVRMVTEVRSDDVPQSGAPIPDATEIAGPVDGAWFSYAGVYEDGAYTTRDESRLVDGKTFSRYVLDEREGVAGDEPEYAQKWTESQTPVDPATAGMGAMVKSLLSSLPAADGLQGQDVEADGLRRSGHDAVRYTLAAPVAGAEDSSVAMTAFTVARSTGELLTVETQSGGVPAVITFSEWNAVPPVEAPAAEDIAPQQAQPQGLGG